MSALAIDFNDVVAARSRLAGITHITPVMQSRTANARSGAELFFKCENLQRVGAFKLRGAYNAIAQLDEAQRRAGVVAYSSGNHGQALALAAQLMGVPATVFMPSDAPAIKQAATRGYGAEVRHFDRMREMPAALARAFAEQHGKALILPFDHVGVMAGQGTLALELLEQVSELDVVLAPIGGGGMLSGIATAVKALRPDCQVYGVEPEAGNDVQRSLAAGERILIDTPDTIADAAQTRQVGELTFPVIQALVDGIVTVSDNELIATMRFLAERMKLVVEPTGALAAAAALHGKLDLAGKRVGIVLSGGNIDLNRFASLIASGSAQ
ncbi:threo-3-hydroxy-L-aspartate ammonia-lyase [Chitinimonas sp.]|uniref:threo-3-hydroxy-L-aspartate ammonia-lyase n=1 Tax=Chitinimonas sp. TaxID=1934313 RepID=UPI0035B165C6